MTDDAAAKDRLVRLICEHAVLDGGDYVLASGERSGIYVDLRRVSLHPRGCALLGTMLLARLAGSGVTAVGGMATAAIPLVAAVVAASAATPAPLRGFYVRDKVKSHGAQRRIEGQMRRGDRIALFEDTMNSGASTMTAADAVLAEGASVACAIAVVDRQRGGAQRFADRNIPFDALVTLAEIKKAAGVP